MKVAVEGFFSKYSGLSLSRTRKGPTNLFEIEKITVKIKIFTNKAREVNKGLLGMYQASSLNAQKTFLFKNFKTLYIKLNRCKK